MTPTQRQAALEALNTLINHYKIGAKYDAEINKIRAALQSSPEPASVGDELLETIIQICNTARCNSKRIVGNRELGERIMAAIRQSSVKENEDE